MTYNFGEAVIDDPTGDHPGELARLAQVFLWLQRSRFSGNLYVEHGRESLVFGFVGGDPVVVEDAASSESLADYFLARGELSQARFAQIVALMTEEIVLNEDATFSEHALRLGFLSRSQINDAVSQRVRAKLIQAVGWDTCRYDMEEGSGPSAEAGLLSVRVGPLVYMGVRTFYFDDEIAKLLGDAVAGYLRLKQSVRAIADMFELEREEVSFLGSIHQETPLRRAVESSGLEPLHARQLIALLRLGQLAVFSASPMPSEPPAEQSGLRVTPEAMPAAPTETAVASPSTQATRPPNPAPAAAVVHAAVPVVRSSPQVTLSQRPITTTSTTTTSRVSSTPSSTLSGVGEASAVGARNEPGSAVPRPSTERNAATARAGRELQRLRERQVSGPIVSPATAPVAGQGTEHLRQLMARRMQAQQASATHPGVGSGPARPAATEPARKPADNFKAALDCLRDQQFGRAAELMRPVLAGAEVTDVQKLYGMWSLYRANPKQESELSNKIKVLARNLMEDATHGSFTYYVLGYFAYIDQKDESAEKLFRKALTLDKHNKDAERHIKIIERRRQNPTVAQDAGTTKIFGITITSGKDKK